MRFRTRAAAIAVMVVTSSLTASGVPALAATSHSTIHRSVAKKPKHKKKHKKKPVAALNTPHIGQVAKDGDFAFTIKSVQCGVTHLGSTTFLSETAPAGSQWCLVSMHVLNDKSSSQSFDASNQYAIDSRGRQLSSTTGAVMYLGNDDSAVFTTVNPGVAVTVVVPYQLSTSDKIAKFILHDSAFSGGVTVYNVA